MKEHHWISIFRARRQDIEGQPIQNEKALFELMIQCGNRLRNFNLAFFKASSRWLRSFRTLSSENPRWR